MDPFNAIIILFCWIAKAFFSYLGHHASLAWTQKPPPPPESGWTKHTEAERDLTAVGGGLIVLGCLAFVGGLAFLFSGERAIGPEAILVVGGGLILIVLIGMSLTSSSGKVVGCLLVAVMTVVVLFYVSCLALLSGFSTIGA